MNKKQRMYKQIEEHGANLNSIFGTQHDNVTLCKKLMRLERKVHHATTCLCNTNTLNLYDVKQATEEEENAFFDKIRASLHNILGEKAEIVHINYDPRGYALKIKDEHLEGVNLYRDFGGYGILAPEFNGE